MASVSLPTDWDFLYIDGSRQQPDHRDSIEVTNPIDGSHVATVPAGSESDIKAAFDAATAAQPEWARTAPRRRAEVLQMAADALRAADFTGVMAAERGSTRQQARLETGPTAVRLLENAADVAKGMSGSDRYDGSASRRRRPRGVVGVLSSWTMPFYHSLRMTAFALATGNVVILKPAAQTPLCGGLLISELFGTVNAPPGVLNVVPGTGAGAGSSLAQLSGLSALAYTGSSDVARHIASQAGEELTIAALQLCGNNPHIVCADANVERALDAAVGSSFRHHGQVCLSTNRHLVHESIVDEYVDGLVERAADLVVGCPTDPSTDVGPMISEAQRETATTFVERSTRAGATLETDGSHSGALVDPTVLSGVEADMAVAKNETFGPIAPISSFGNRTELNDFVTAHPFGNVVSVHTGSVERGRHILDAIDGQRSETNVGRTDALVNPALMTDDATFDDTRGHFFGEYDRHAWLNWFTRGRWLAAGE